MWFFIQILARSFKWKRGNKKFSYRQYIFTIVTGLWHICQLSLTNVTVGYKYYKYAVYKNGLKLFLKKYFIFILQSNLAIRNFFFALKLFLTAKSEVNGKLVTGNGSLILICSLSKSSLLPSPTVTNLELLYRHKKDVAPCII